MGQPHPLEIALADAWPPEAWQDVTVLLAISGGADSVALLRAICALKTGGEGRVCVAHFNHRLRGEESATDEAFVVDLAARFNLPCQLGSAGDETSPEASGDGLEAAARAARYEFLRRTAARLGARYVVTAHTADDQIETILHRIVRGTGIVGLAGMRRARPLGSAASLIRPLLGFRRARLVAYLDDLGQPCRYDSTNADVRFTRNRIRHELLPLLAVQFNPGVTDALLRLGNLAGEVQAVADSLVNRLAGQCVVAEGADAVRVETRVLAGEHRYLVRELFMAVWRRQGWPMQAMGFTEWDLLAEMAQACAGGTPDPPSKQTLPGNILAEPAEGHVRLVRLRK